LYVTNFPNTAQEDEIVSVFQKYGNVVKSKLPKDENGKLKGFGFFTFEKPE
jgi:RNA recognition motif-containing protein